MNVLCRFLVSAMLASVSLSSLAGVRELPLPEVPKQITVPEDRAGYVLCHFWDGMDWSDSVWVTDGPAMEQNFVNFVSVFPHASAASVNTAVDVMFEKLRDKPEAYEVMADIAAMYLNDTESPMRDDRLYVVFLNRFLEDKVLDEARLIRYRYQMDDVSKNLPGTIAGDFPYTDSNGRESTLHALWGAGYTILMFYDPECRHCHQVIDFLSRSEPVNRRLDEKSLRILAVDTSESDMPADALSIPPTWVSARTDESVEDAGLYSFREMPALYLLSPGNEVILKDASPEAIIKILSDIE